MKYIFIIYIHCCPSLLKHCRQKYLEARKAQSLKYDLSTRSIPDQEIIPHCELSPSGRHYKRHTVDGSKSITPIVFRIVNAASLRFDTHFKSRISKKKMGRHFILLWEGYFSARQSLLKYLCSSGSFALSPFTAANTNS